MTTHSDHLSAGDGFGGAAFERIATAAAFPTDPHPSREVYQFVHDELLLDGAARANLATFCTTWVPPEVERLMTESVAKNLIDKDEYPRTAELERRCVRMLGDLFHAPDPDHATGTSTIGSSEAAMLAGLAAKWRWRERRRAAGQSTGTPNIVCGSVQVCWEKFARYFDVELRQQPMQDGYLLTPEQVLAAVDEDTIAVVVTFGQTFTGLFEDVAAICAALDDLQARTGLDVPVHVDGASGGFVAPFCAPEVVWDFRLDRVRSINVSGHKTGLAPLGVGWVLWREAADLPDGLVFDVDYLGGDMPTFTLNFSRPGGQVIASYYLFLHLGRSGYRAVHENAYTVAQRIAEVVGRMDQFEVVSGGDPATGIPAVCWRATDPAAPYSLFDVAEVMRSHGWLVPAYPLPADRQHEVVQRVVVRHGVSLDMADRMLDDLRSSVDRLEARPPSVPAGTADGGSFNHDAAPRVATHGVARVAAD